MIKNFLIQLWRDESGFFGDIFRLGLGLLGGAAGFLIGGPAGAQLGFLAGSLLGAVFFGEDLPTIEGQRLDPNQIMTSAYGDPIAIGIGRFVVGGTLGYYPGFDEHEVESEGGLFGTGGGIKSYTYTGNFRVNWCEGPADAVLKIWASRTLIYDRTNTANPIVDIERLNNAPGVNAIRIYLGTEDQLPDPKELELEGIDATNSYRGIVGGFFQNYPLDDTGGAPPQMTALIASHATEALPFDDLPGGAIGATWEWQPGKSTFLTGRDLRISNISQTIIASNGPFGGLPQFPCVDSSGNFYSLEDNFGTGRSAQCFKWSGVTLSLLETSAEFHDPVTGAGIGGSVNFGKGRIFGGVQLPTGVIGRELLWSQRDGSGAIVVIDPEHLQSETGGVISHTATEIDYILSIVVDLERFLWAASNEGGVVTVHRYSPGSGAKVEGYVVADVTSIDHMSYDEQTNCLILARTGDYIMRWSLDTHLEVGRISGFAYVNDNTKNRSEFWNGPTGDGKLILQIGAILGQFQRIDIHNFIVESRIWSPFDDWGLSTNLIHRGMHDESRNAMMKRRDTGANIYWLYLDRKVGDVITVKQVVDLIAGKVGLTGIDIDTSNLTDQLHGYLVGSRMAANRALEPLRQMFFFNPVSEDFIIKFPTLGGSPVATIPEDDLAAGDGDGPRVEVDRLVEELMQEIELPETLELSYANDQAEYQSQVQTVKRPRSSTSTKRRRSLVFPGTFLSNSNAKQRLQSLLYNIWLKRRPVLFRTAQKWLRLSPTDVINVEEGGVTQQVILAEVTHGANRRIEFSGAADDPSTLVSVAIGAEGIIPVQTIDLIAPSEYFVFDFPIFRSQDAGFGAYLAGGPVGDGAFRGEELHRGTDGVLFGPFHFIPKDRAVDHGFVVGAVLPDADADFWDRDSVITIQMLRGTLSSSTEALVIDGANPLAIGKELCNYVTATDLGNSKYTVSTLLRGRKGTGGETGAHVAEEKVVVIDENTFIRKGLNLSDLNIDFFYKGVTRGGSFSDGIRKLIKIEGKSEWTWAPVHVSGSITSDDWTVSWKWRNFLNPEWKNLLAVPHPSNFDYEVDILSGPGGSVLATYSTTASANGSVVTALSHTFFYDDADQTIDLGAPAATITIKIYPMVVNIGRGFPKEVTLVGG